MSNVCVLGMSLICSAGPSLSESWPAIVSGRVTISELPPDIARWVEPKYGYVADMGYFAAMPSNRLSTMTIRAAESRTIGNLEPDTVILGSTSAGFQMMENDPVSPPPGSLVEMLAGRYGGVGRFQLSNACASSSYAIALGTELIRRRDARIVLAGGADELAASVISSFSACRIYADRCKPFDAHRKGVVLGEAAAFVLLASYETALEHDIQPLAYITGVGLTSDAQHEAAAGEQGIRDAIYRATETDVGEVDFVCAHGTGTKQNDLVEANAVFHALEADNPYVSSYKGAIGHPQGASGAVGLVLTIMTIQSDIVFPTAGLDVVDPDLPPLRFPKEAVRTRINKALVLSHGSWGTNSAILISRS